MYEYEKETFWTYEKMQDGKIKTAPRNDYDGSITGAPRFEVKQWFDENPDEARRLGWVKHIQHNIDKYVEYNKLTQYVMVSHKYIDNFTYEDEYHVLDKTEEMMRNQEENHSYAGYGLSSIVFEL
jgi:hypothetical protein